MIYPDCDMKRWEYCNNTVVLGNADYYYTKEQVDEKIDEVSGMTPDDVQEMIDWSIKDKADKSDVSTLAEQVVANTQGLLERYTKAQTDALLSLYYNKTEVDSKVANYATVSNEILTLNSENIT